MHNEIRKKQTKCVNRFGTYVLIHLLSITDPYDTHLSAELYFVTSPFIVFSNSL